MPLSLQNCGLPPCRSPAQRPTVPLPPPQTERDPDFSDKVVAALGRNAHRTRVIVVCGVGGTLETAVTVASTGKVAHNDPDRAFGRESRALKACYELLKAKFSKVEFLKGGHGSWRHGGFPMDYGHADEE